MKSFKQGKEYETYGTCSDLDYSGGVATEEDDQRQGGRGKTRTSGLNSSFHDSAGYLEAL